MHPSKDQAASWPATQAKRVARGRSARTPKGFAALLIAASLVSCNLPQPEPSGIPLRTEQGGGR